jgi:hypothetical protein
VLLTSMGAVHRPWKVVLALANVLAGLAAHSLGCDVVTCSRTRLAIAWDGRRTRWLGGDGAVQDVGTAGAVGYFPDRHLVAGLKPGPSGAPPAEGQTRTAWLVGAWRGGRQERALLVTVGVCLPL